LGVFISFLSNYNHKNMNTLSHGSGRLDTNPTQRKRNRTTPPEGLIRVQAQAQAQEQEQEQEQEQSWAEKLYGEHVKNLEEEQARRDNPHKPP
jgi:hypothetical protein